MENEKEKNIGLTRSGSFRAMENLQEIQRMPGISPINLNYFGAEQCEKGYSFGPFVRTSYVIHFIRRGKGRLCKGGSVYEVSEGQAFLIYPGEETTYCADEDDPWNYTWVGFHGFLAEEMTARAGFAPEQPVVRCENMEEILSTMERLLSCCELTYENDLKRTGFLYQLMGLLSENSRAGVLQEDPDECIEKRYVRKAVDLMINAHNPQVKVSEVAGAIGISRGYLTRIFQKEMGVSPQEFLTRFRMERAGDLLRSTKSQISTIALELGYSDVLSFSKSFRRHFGMSPTAFREQKVIVISSEEKGSYTSKHPL